MCGAVEPGGGAAGSALALATRLPQPAAACCITLSTEPLRLRRARLRPALCPNWSKPTQHTHLVQAAVVFKQELARGLHEGVLGGDQEEVVVQNLGQIKPVDHTKERAKDAKWE